MTKATTRTMQELGTRGVQKLIDEATQGAQVPPGYMLQPLSDLILMIKSPSGRVRVKAVGSDTKFKDLIKELESEEAGRLCAPSRDQSDTTHPEIAGHASDNAVPDGGAASSPGA